MNSKCPSCGETINRLLGEIVPVKSDQLTRHAMTYRCPSCNIVVGCQSDPADMQRQLAKAIEDAFRRRGMA